MFCLDVLEHVRNVRKKTANFGIDFTIFLLFFDLSSISSLLIEESFSSLIYLLRHRLTEEVL